MGCTIMRGSTYNGRIYENESVNEYDVSFILSNYYPDLLYYYQENVLMINSIQEVVLENGEISYLIDYDFCRYYYTNHGEILECLRLRYPNIYRRYLNGTVVDIELYKYVKESTGEIKYHLSYRNNYYYHPRRYYSYPYYHRPPARPIKPSPRPPKPNVRPNNPPRPDANRPNVNRSENKRPDTPRPNNGRSGGNIRPNSSRPNNSGNVRPNNSRPSTPNHSSHNAPRSGGSQNHRR